MSEPISKKAAVLTTTTKKPVFLNADAERVSSWSSSSFKPFLPMTRA